MGTGTIRLYHPNPRKLVILCKNHEQGALEKRGELLHDRKRSMGMAMRAKRLNL
ncbi:hypothetical protein ACNKHP_20845 [Shigella boydii]